MKNKTIMKIISVCFIFILVFTMSSNIYAAINENYGEQNEVVETDLEGKLQNSALLEAIASLVYGVGSLVETLVGEAFQILTGTNTFPWADRVIFNTVPFLDVNFLNPSENSLFLTGSGEDTPLATVVRNMYFTVLILAIGFLGIIVGVMAIRLAISTIAAEKAKYKQAIVNFLVALVMLFCVHYVISLVFYINESLVEIASGMLKESLKDTKINTEIFQDSLTDEQLIENFFRTQDSTIQGLWEDFESQKDQIMNDPEKVAIAAFLLRDTTYKKYAIPEAFGNGESEKNFLSKLDNYLPWTDDNNNAVDILFSDVVRAQSAEDRNGNNSLKARLDQYNQEGAEAYINGLGSYEYEKYMEEEYEEWVNYYTMLNITVTEADEMWNNNGKNNAKEEYITEVLPIAMEITELLVKAGNAETRVRNMDVTTIISEMGYYFKQNAWTYETDEHGNVQGWDNNSLTLQGALLYAIFVFQSVLFFVAYIKRFFYVVILAMLAPVVVIYDFLGKAIS